MNLPEIRAYGKRWQERMRLLDWDITWRWMTKAECKQNPEFNGFVQWSCEHRRAWIAIARTSEYIPHTVIHELTHLRVQGHLPQEAVASSTFLIPEEVAINALTEMLLDLEGGHRRC